MLIYLQMINSPGERSKFEILYYRYKDLMFSVAFSVLRNEREAEDAVHQAFVKIIENISKISDPKCPKTRSYVVTIVENTAINLYRRKKRHPSVPFEEWGEGIAVEYTGSNELARCMAQLPANYRQVLLLKYCHGYTAKEIAKMLGLTQANVASLLQRAKAKLEILCKEAEIL